MSEITKEEKKRKKILVITIVAVLLLASTIVGYIYHSQKKYTPPPPTPKVELTGTKDIAKESWIAQSAAQIQAQKQEIDELKKIVSTLQDKGRGGTGSTGQFPPGAPPAIQGVPTSGSPQLGSSPSFDTPPIPSAQPSHNEGTYYPPPPTTSRTSGQQARAGALGEKVLSNLIAIDEGRGGAASTQASKEKQDSRKKSERAGDELKSDSFIPSGSFVKVVLLNGIDAPTGSKGKGNPYPVLLRVLEFAQLPNLWKGDFKECFMIGEAVGELSSERVHIRTNTLSCINRKGEVLEGNISGYAVGEDGKIGLSGRVVTKQGALLARSLVTGFLQGVSSAFSQSANVLSITPTGNISTIDPNKTAQAGIGMGISKATEDLAKFYIEMAKDLFPVIEANSGRRVEVVLVSKATLAKVTK
jgi:conjugal transfer pilus assembly protein TraB